MGFGQILGTVESGHQMRVPLSGVLSVPKVTASGSEGGVPQRLPSIEADLWGRCASKAPGRRRWLVVGTCELQVQSEGQPRQGHPGCALASPAQGLPPPL